MSRPFPFTYLSLDFKPWEGWERERGNGLGGERVSASICFRKERSITKNWKTKRAYIYREKARQTFKCILKSLLKHCTMRLTTHFFSNFVIFLFFWTKKIIIKFKKKIPPTAAPKKKGKKDGHHMYSSRTRPLHNYVDD